MGALTFDALLRSLKQGVSAAVYYLHGDEDVLKDEAVRGLVERAVEPAARDFNVDQVDAPTLAAEAFHAFVNTPPMLARTALGPNGSAVPGPIATAWLCPSNQTINDDCSAPGRRC